MFKVEGLCGTVEGLCSVLSAASTLDIDGWMENIIPFSFPLRIEEKTKSGCRQPRAMRKIRCLIDWKFTRKQARRKLHYSFTKTRH